MIETKHTQGKLEAKEETDGHFGIYPRELRLCLAIVWDDPELDAKANALRFVSCWNSRDAQQEKIDALLEALKKTNKWLQENTQATNRPASLDKQIMDALSAAESEG